MATRLLVRPTPPRFVDQLVQEGLHPLMARLMAARGIRSAAELNADLAGLLAPGQLRGVDGAARLIADAIEGKKRIVIVADYDCDGATACAVGLRGLRAMRTRAGGQAEVRFIVPDRFRFGYGLTPEIVRLAAELRPDLLVTVDNGIASLDGVEEANRLGMQVIVTDHHLPADAAAGALALPAAAAIVNPNQPGCGFPSKHLAGVGVMFYTLLAVRAELRARGAFAPAGDQGAEPNLAELLDLVALGTVADVVALDRNNRVLVAQGLRRIRAGRLQPGLRALFAVAGRDPRRASGFDLGFVLGPRINAAGRLQDMSLGIECLATDDYGRALEIARSLDELNRERRAIEGDMREQAERMLAELTADAARLGDTYTLALFDPAWHQGVVGILAGRVKDLWHRPTIAFARSDASAGAQELKGSGRSIRGLHLRDALDRVAKRAPGLLLRFGGHAAAAGVTILERDYPRFIEAFEAAAREMLPADALAQSIETDGSLEPGYMNLATAQMLEEQIWGQGFPQPLYCDEFAVAAQRIVGEKHLKLRLRRQGDAGHVEAMQFNALAPLPASVRAAYRVAVNEFNGVQSLQLVIEHWEPA
jgi:single-stranded-DNA-specific exonuclease